MVSVKAVSIVICVITVWAVVGTYFYINSSHYQLTTSPVVSYSATCAETNQYEQCLAYGSVTSLVQTTSTIPSRKTSTVTGVPLLQRTTTFSNPLCVNTATAEICVSSRNYGAIISSNFIQSQCCNDSNIFNGYYNGTEIGTLKLVMTKTLNDSQVETTSYNLTVTAASIFTLTNGSRASARP